MSKRDIIVIGASAGGFEALRKLVKALPADLNASIFIVWHMSPDIRGVLPQVLNGVNSIVAAHAYDREPVRPNRIYVAPPDHHMMLEDGLVRITKGPKENRFRPAVDPLFRSAAYTYGSRVVGVILSGALDDGTSGLWTIKENGGIAVAQDPRDAEVPSMPESAIREVAVDHIVPVKNMAALLEKLTAEPIESEPISSKTNDLTKVEISIAKGASAFEAGIMEMGEQTAYTCPECHGVLTRVADGKRERFRCHTGHAYSTDSLLSVLSETIENTLYSALRGIEESIILLNHIGDRHAEANEPVPAAKYFKKAAEAELRATAVRRAAGSTVQLNAGIILSEDDQK